MYTDVYHLYAYMCIYMNLSKGKCLWWKQCSVWPCVVYSVCCIDDVILHEHFKGLLIYQQACIKLVTKPAGFQEVLVYCSLNCCLLFIVMIGFALLTQKEIAQHSVQSDFLQIFLFKNNEVLTGLEMSHSNTSLQ